MKNEEVLSQLSKEDLIKLIEMYSKNLVALDGLWFQSIERKFGMNEAIYHDEEAWKRCTVIEANRIKEFLHLEEHPGILGLKKALQLRFNTNINEDSFVLDKNTLVYTVNECRVQAARKRKNMPYHPCKSVGMFEYANFAKTIDDRFTCRCLSCYPDMTDDQCSCKWEFTLNEDM